MKKLINEADQVVDQMLDGLVAAYPGLLQRLPGRSVITRSTGPTPGKVGLVSGGGSGHEPAHAGFVGHGMLDAAVAGAVFTSPTPDQVLAGIQAANGGAGVLLIIKNYTGDVMNFEMAAELAQAEGIETAAVVVNDDVAVEDSTWTTGRRGIAGTILVHKIAGAKAEAGGSLAEVQAVAEKVVTNLRSMGMALTPCILPAAGKAGFELGEDEVEIGMGIHGEPGTHRESLRTAAETTTLLTQQVMTDLGLQAGDEVAVLVNGLGATPMMELLICNKTVAELLHEAGIKTYRTFVGEYMTSLEMAGFSVSLLRLDAEMKELLDAAAETPALRQGR